MFRTCFFTGKVRSLLLREAQWQHTIMITRQEGEDKHLPALRNWAAAHGTLQPCNNYFVFKHKDPRSKIYVEVYDDIVWILMFETLLADSMVLQTVLFWDFFWRSGLLEYWIRLYVLGHFFGCSLWPGMPLNSPWKLASSVPSSSLTLQI